MITYLTKNVPTFAFFSVRKPPTFFLLFCYWLLEGLRYVYLAIIIYYDFHCIRQTALHVFRMLFALLASVWNYLNEERRIEYIETVKNPYFQAYTIKSRNHKNIWPNFIKQNQIHVHLKQIWKLQEFRQTCVQWWPPQDSNCYWMQKQTEPLSTHHSNIWFNGFLFYQDSLYIVFKCQHYSPVACISL